MIDAQKMGAEPRLVPLRDHRYDLEAMLDAISPGTKSSYICCEQPDGNGQQPCRARRVLRAVPDHVLTVIDQAYFEYVDDLDYTDAVETYFKEGRNVLVVRTFSKIYGLAGLRIGYGVGPEALVHALGKVRRAFDMSTTSQEAALASLDNAPRSSAGGGAIAAAMRSSRRFSAHTAWCRSASAGELPLRDLGEDASALFESLLREA